MADNDGMSLRGGKMKTLDLTAKPRTMPAPGFIYFMSMYDEHAPEEHAHVYVKIGFATDLEARRKHLQTASPFDLQIEASFRGSKDDEQALHKRLAAHQVRREWYRYDDDFEDFLYDLQDARGELQFERGEDYDPTLQECLAQL